MKKLILLTAFIMIAVSAGFGQKAASGSAKTDPAKGVHDAFDRLVEGIRQVDAAKVMSAYDRSDKILIFNNNGTATMGWDNIKANVDATYPKLKNVTLEITGLKIEMLSRTTAYVTCKWRQAQENEGKLENASGRMTLVYKLVGKDWKIIHRHTSPDNPPASRPVFPSERVEQ